ncbi:TetR/AcrR family transcriptional regulator [Oceanobacillus sp. CAU 1775]
MTSKKIDRRIRYSQMALKASLLQLLKEKQFSNVTVKEICEHADINRSTFYAHYTDQYHLLEEIEEEMISDLNNYLSAYDFNEKDEVLLMTEKLIEYLSTKKDEVQVLLNVSGDSSFQLKVMEVAKGFITKEWNVYGQLDEELSNYLSTFIISGSVQVIKQWLNGETEKSPRQMAEFITGLINQGVYGIGK